MAAEVYRDRWLLVVDKPAGQPSQRTRAGEDGLYEALCDEELYVGLHHRLDRQVSGLILFTLDPTANAGISQALKQRTLSRSYRALLEGPCATGSWTWSVDKAPARTDVELESVVRGVSRVTCHLHTGRTHQIRVHAAMNGTPVVGDTRYGGDLTRPLPRIALHAWRLALTHPVTAEPLEFHSPREWDTLTDP